MIRAPHMSAGRSIIEQDVDSVIQALGSPIQRLSGARVLITGASGFLPAYLADVLAGANRRGALAEPCRLLLLTRQPVVPDSRLGHLLGRDDVDIVVHDVQTPLEGEWGADYIVHAASPASPGWFRRDPVGTIRANVFGLGWLLEHARLHGSRGLLYLSSSEVYGSPPAGQIPTSEEYVGSVAFASSRSCYSEAKRMGEAMCVAYHDQHGVPANAVRTFHTHGPGLRLDDGRIVAEMMRRGLAGEPFELMSDGRSTRTYGYVSDAMIAFLLVLLSDARGEAFNVGADGPETTVYELTRMIAAQFGVDTVLTSDEPVPDHLSDAPDRVCPDLTKIRSTLGFRPRVGLEEGIERTARWFKAVYGEGAERG